MLTIGWLTALVGASQRPGRSAPRPISPPMDPPRPPTKPPPEARDVLADLLVDVGHLGGAQLKGGAGGPGCVGVFESLYAGSQTPTTHETEPISPHQTSKPHTQPAHAHSSLARHRLQLRVGQREAQHADGEPVDEHQRREVGARQQHEERAKAVGEEADAQRGEDRPERDLCDGKVRVGDDLGAGRRGGGDGAPPLLLGLLLLVGGGGGARAVCEGGAPLGGRVVLVGWGGGGGWKGEALGAVR